MSAIDKDELDIDATELFPFKWAKRIQDATISTKDFVISPEGGITVEASSIDNTNKKVVAKLKVGTAALGDTVRVTNRITTSDGEELDLSLDITIVEK